MNSITRFQLPFDANTPPRSLTAAGLGANKGYWMHQLRDPKTGKFIKMGGSIHFLVKTDKGQYKYVHGTFEGSDGTSSKISVKKNPYVSQGTYHINNNNISAVKATIGGDDDYLIQHGIDINDVTDVDQEDKQHAQDVASLKPANDDSTANKVDTSEPAHWASIKQGNAYPQSENESDFTDEQIKALEWFTDTGYEEAQKHYVRGEDVSEDSKKKLDIIRELIDSNSAQASEVLYRGLATTNQAYADQIHSYKPGDIVHGRNFSSHSTDMARAEFYSQMELGDVKARVMFRTMTPQGSKGFRIPDWVSSYGSSEKEILFPPDTKYKVAKVSQDENGTTIVDLEVVDTPSLPKEGEVKKPAIPSPAMMPKKKAPAPEKPKALDFPSETKTKPEQKLVKALDGNSQPIKKGDTVHFQLERDGKSFKVEGEYLGVSLGSLSGLDDANKPFIRIKGQDGIKGGDYPIRADILNLGPGDSNFRDTRTPLASKLEAEGYVPDATRLTQVTKAEHDALFAYTTENVFDDIRTLMQKHPGKTLEDIKQVATSKQDQETLNQLSLIEDAIYKSPLAEDTKLYRGIEILDDADFEMVLKSLKVGEPLYDASIVSTSSDPKVAEKFAGFQGILLEIDAPAGSPALETPWFYSGLENIEDEYMLPRNSEFEIVSIGEPVNDVVPVKVKYRPPLTRQAQGIATPQLTQPQHKTINPDSAKFNSDGTISVPKSPEAKDLETLGTLASPEVLKQIDDKTRDQFTKDPGFKPFDPGLATKAQIDSLNDLTPTGESAFAYVDSSLKTNKLLRTRDAATEVSKDVKNLDEAILISEHLPPGATVYRMMKLKRWEALNLVPGQVLFDRGFMSTTLSKDYVDEMLKKNKESKSVAQVPMKIVMPNNTSGISLRPVSWFLNENEYLLPRNTALRFLGWSSSGEAVFERVT